MKRHSLNAVQSSSSSSSSSSSNRAEQTEGSRTTTRTRTIRICRSVILSAAVMVAVMLAHGADKLSLPADTTGFKLGPGSDLATVQCVLCHSADYVSTQPRLPRVAWKATVLKMRDKYGAPLPDDKVETLVDYLVKTYGAEAAQK